LPGDYLLSVLPHFIHIDILYLFYNFCLDEPFGQCGLEQLLHVVDDDVLHFLVVLVHDDSEDVVSDA
jgi:hypothetical protein